ncbi:chemotaxis protein CheA [Jannaschia sp. R86511]|uniref:chemotaxis protein CheA n=1 Tax=Jannaschia sp. R86511 TaxID=3093853 RepID=UPI0036D2AF7A
MSGVTDSADGMDEIVQEFLVESHENLDQLDRDFVELEQDPHSRDLLASVFRTIHTIKGTSGFLGFGNLERVTHVGENLLAKLRDGDRTLDARTTDVLLLMVDAVRAVLAEIESVGVDEACDVSATVEAVRAILEQPAGPEAVVDPEPVAEPVAESVAEPVAAAEPEPTDEPAPEPADEPAPVEPATAALVDAEPVADLEPEVTAEAAAPVPPVVPAPAVPASAAPAPAPAKAVEVEPETAAPAGKAPADAKKRSAVDSSIRVDVDVLENLMQLVGELVLSRNRVLQLAADSSDTDLVRSAHHLDLISSSLQEAVMKTRMQPMDYLWAKLPRVVRDLSAQCGKEIDLVMHGRETELDRTLLDAVKDPLTHLVRNSIDHGVETPDVRQAAGKARRGTLTLRAYHESGQVVMEIGDDGKGIDPDMIGRKAVEKGLVTADELAAMSRRAVLDLIFRPGFSTADAVTNVSGRGVGMDVVRTNIEKIGGSVDLTSTPGHGTVMRVTIPLTLAIIPALIVRQGEERYAIPQANLLELVRMNPDDPTKGVEYVAGVPVHRLRGRLLPLLDLGEQLGADSERRAEATIAVLRSDNNEFGLVVDEVLETQEIVVKPLGAALTSLQLFAGAAVMGDGRIALILDVLGLAGAGRVSHSAASITSTMQQEAGLTGEESDLTSLLVVRTDGARNVAVPLDKVARLEEVPVTALEHVGSSTVVQYRGDLLPVVEVDGGGWGGGFVPSQGGPPDSESYGEAVVGHVPTVTLVVYQHGERLVGLRVKEIVDIVEVPLVLSPIGARSGSLGSLVVNGHITDVLDVSALAAPFATEELSYVH